MNPAKRAHATSVASNTGTAKPQGGAAVICHQFSPATSQGGARREQQLHHNAVAEAAKQKKVSDQFKAATKKAHEEAVAQAKAKRFAFSYRVWLNSCQSLTFGGVYGANYAQGGS